MIDIQSYFMSLKASWVSKLISNDISNWKLIPLKYLSVVGINWLIFKMNFEKKKILDYIKHIPEFYREVFKCWVISGGGQTKKPTNFTEVRKQVFWGNNHINSENKTIIFENWIKSNVT